MGQKEGNRIIRDVVLQRNHVDIFTFAAERMAIVLKAFRALNSTRPTPTPVQDFDNALNAVIEAQAIADQNKGSSKGGKGSRPTPIRP